MTTFRPPAHLLLAADIEFVSDGQITFELQASDEGRLLLFRNAILARAETNKNLDEILPEEIDNLAATIAGCAIDLEHNAAVNIGVFTGGRGIDTPLGRALSVDGLIWADRYPTQAQGVRNGSHELSVEATADSVECSQCGKVFAAKGEYCEHLKAKRKFQAKRTARGLKSVGGAVTQRPAGTATQFDRSQLWLVASHAETEDPPMECPRCHKISATEGNCSHCAKSMSPAVIAQELDEAMRQLATAQTQLTAAQESVTTLTASVDAEKSGKLTAEQALEAAKAQLATVEAAKVEAETRATAAREQLRRNQLSAHIDEAGWAEKKADVMAMTDSQFNLFLGAYGAQPRREAEATGVFIPTPGRNGQTPITLGKKE